MRKNPLAEKLITVPLDPTEYNTIFDNLSDHELLEFASWSQRQASAFDVLTRKAIHKVAS